VVDLGLRKGREKFLNFSDDPIPEKEIFVFLAANAKPTPLDYVSGVHLVINHLLDECANSIPAYLTIDQ